MEKLSFSGHESFVCRQFWLKKGVDFVHTKKKFSHATAVIDLGVGKNMVSSIRFWLKAFDLVDENDEPQDIAEYLFGENGCDPYLEDYGTAWLLHYYLIKNGRASIYNLVFNKFRKERIEFTKEQLHSFLKRECLERGSKSYNKNTITSDINVFLRSYNKPQQGDKIEIEDDFTGVLIDLNLVQRSKQRNNENKLIDLYRIESSQRSDLPYQIVFFSILDKIGSETSVSMRELLVSENSPGLIFAMNSEGLYNKLLEIEQNYPEVTYSETAGNQVLQLKSKIDKWNILNEYYGL